jgi:hypothetical protein
MEHFIERENKRDNFNKLQIFKGKGLLEQVKFCGELPKRYLKGGV